MTGADSAAETLAVPARSAEQAADEVFSPGTVLGRFIVHRVLGRGGAGVVYAAHDPELDRTIALKVLRRELADRQDARARFLREAQALARLSHPNVIAVFDVGTEDGRVFMAMEYLHGQTLRDWCERSKRSWPAIVGVLISGGRGLAAAHAAGLIHRDFKPANLLIGVDGRVVVTDFGLARAVMEPDDHVDPPGGSREELRRDSTLAVTVTARGATPGTPAYMAPEQRAAERADARADQFSFCVTLYEALFGEHPFPTWRSATALAAGSELVAPDPSDSRGVPASIQRIVQRGLRWRPEDRHASMDVLLAALGRAAARRRRLGRLALVATALAVTCGGLAVVIAGILADRGVTDCAGGREQFAEVWGGAKRAQVRSAFMATDRPHARSTADRVAQRLDAYSGRWTALHRAACLATARGEQSPELLDRRMACLGLQRARVGALVELFGASPGGELVDRAIQLVDGLEPLETCADAAVLLATAPPPSDPARRARAAEMAHRAERAEIERRAGRPQAAADGARAVLDAERTIEYDPLAAQAGRVLGLAFEDLGRPADARQAILRARWHAERAGDIQLSAHLLLDLLRVVGVLERLAGEAHLLGDFVEATLQRPELRHDSAMRARMLSIVGLMSAEEGRLERAVDLQREVLSLRRRTFFPLSEEVASAEYNLATAFSRMARYDEAREHHAEALAIRRSVFGDEHPLVADVHIGLGIIEHLRGRFDDARTSYRAALAIYQRMPSHQNYPRLLNNLASLEDLAGDRQQARKYHEAALEILIRQFGPEHPDVAVSLNNFGNFLYNSGDFALALETHRRALALRAKNPGPQHPAYADSLVSIGEDLRRLGRPGESVEHQDRALDIYGAGKEHPQVSFALAYKGLALVDRGHRRQAIPILERAIELLPSSHPDRARAAFALARALSPRRPTTRRATALAREALQIFTDMRTIGERDEVAAYLGRKKAR